MFFRAVLEASLLPRPSVSPLSLKMTNDKTQMIQSDLEETQVSFWSRIGGAAVDRDRGGASGGGTSHRLDIIRSRWSSPVDQQTNRLFTDRECSLGVVGVRRGVGGGSWRAGSPVPGHLRHSWRFSAKDLSGASSSHRAAHGCSFITSDTWTFVGTLVGTFVASASQLVSAGADGKRPDTNSSGGHTLPHR